MAAILRLLLALLAVALPAAAEVSDALAEAPVEGSAAHGLPMPLEGGSGRGLHYMVYRNDQFRIAVQYPRDLFPRDEAIGRGEGRTFVSADGSARFHVSGQRNEIAGFTARELLRLSTAHYRDIAAAHVTYTRLARHWYVVSGTRDAPGVPGGRRIFYEKGVISADGRFAGTLLIEYPLARKSFFDPIVTRMSRSFQPAGAAFR